MNPGLPAGTDAGGPDFSFRPDSPQPGATPEQIVTGFIRAGSGPADNWAIAREYLAPSISSDWDPSAGVTIDVESDRDYESPVEDQVVLTLTAVASTDAIGAYSQVEAGPTEVPFQLAAAGGRRMAHHAGARRHRPRTATSSRRCSIATR